MKRTIIPSAMAAAPLLISLFGCGHPARLKTLSLIATAVSAGGFHEIRGEGGTLQLTTTGEDNNGGRQNLTNQVTYTVTPTGTDLGGFPLLASPQTLTVNATGLVTAVSPSVCTFHNAGTDTTPNYVLVGAYRIVATDSNGAVSKPILIGIASEAGDGPGGACGP
jgi:hypothetical protein